MFGIVTIGINSAFAIHDDKGAHTTTFSYPLNEFTYFFETDYVRYEIPTKSEYGIVNDIRFDEQASSLILDIDSSPDAQTFEIDISFALFENTHDDYCFILADGEEIECEKSPRQNYAHLKFLIPPKTQQIEIIHAFIPEFDPPKSFQIIHDPPYSYILPPLKQIKNGVDFKDVYCVGNLDLIFRPNYSGVACVKDESTERLAERNWIESPFNNEILSAPKDISSYIENATSSYMGKIIPTLDDFKNTLSEPYNIDTILTKFGEPHDDIGSGIHIYVYELNDLTEIWVGYSDDILYVKHVDSDGIELENLLAKKTESKTAYEDDFDLPEVKLFLEKYPQAGIISDHMQYEIHTKHYMYTDSYT